MMDQGKQQEREHLRPARMRIEATALMSRGSQSVSTELEDISSSGLMVCRPAAWRGELSQEWVLDLLFAQDLHIHLEATVVRISQHHIGYAYSRIPENKEVALWELLGGYADTLENW